ncbi:MAG: hypothetical protein M3680_19765, partial [Myxococcota bacterium]|nr:hypothetical protein [Myxococcota bacterium]
MAARTPRRIFASPFVVTLAAIPACYATTTSDPSPPQPIVAHGGPTQPTRYEEPSPPPPSAPSPGTTSQPVAGGTVISNPPRPQPA